MNIHVPQNIREKWTQYEFVGLPVKKNNGKTYMRAKYKHWPWQGNVHIYCFEDDIFWHSVTIQEAP